MPTPVLENPEHQTKWYSRYFLGKFHRNYVGQDATDAKSFYALSGELSGGKKVQMQMCTTYIRELRQFPSESETFPLALG